MTDSNDPVRERAHKIAESFLEKGDHYGWFEALYSEADGDNEQIPWADLVPNKFLVEWERNSRLSGEGKKALVIGCGLGDDANFLADRGFTVTAFDVSETAIEWAKKLYPSEKIDFLNADLFNAPPEWPRAFDLVLEIYTVQALPLHLRDKAIATISSFAAPGGEIIVVSRYWTGEGEPEGPPWPLSESDFEKFSANGLHMDGRMRFDDTEDEIPRVVERFVGD